MYRKPLSNPSVPSRRQFLRYVGAGASSAVAASLLPVGRTSGAPLPPTTMTSPRPPGGGGESPWMHADGTPAWKPVEYPVPHPGDAGTALAYPLRLASYTARDELVLPGGFRYDVIARWGDELGPADRLGRRLPFELEWIGMGCEPPLDGRQYGWVCEIDPAAGTLRKHTALGRFRHENVAIRCERGRRLAAYMGDDRRGGHVWKFVSDEEVADPADPANRRLLERGTLYVARLDPDYTGRWVPLAPGTPLARPEPRHCADGVVMLPRRPAGGGVAVETGEKREIPVYTWVKSVERFAGKPLAQCTLGDLVRPEVAPGGDAEHRAAALLLLDAQLMANAAGGTPCARPEDVEVHPADGSVYVSFTDSTGSDEGSPDARIFPDSGGEDLAAVRGDLPPGRRRGRPGGDDFRLGEFREQRGGGGRRRGVRMRGQPRVRPGRARVDGLRRHDAGAQLRRRP